MINLVTISGIILGLVAGGSTLSNYYLSTMFFLTPRVRQVHKTLAPFVKEISTLDYGWLEPASIVKNYHSKLGSFVSEVGAWPNKQAFFTCVMLLISFSIVSTAYF